jgi:hypothetical protein
MAHSVERVLPMLNKNVKQQKAKIVFVCVENAGRSQMAQGFAEAFGKGRLEVYSAGSLKVQMDLYGISAQDLCHSAKQVAMSVICILTLFILIFNSCSYPEYFEYAGVRCCLI